MAASVYNSILDAVVSQVTNLGLVFNMSPLPVMKMKLPKAQETLDVLPLVAVAPGSEAERVEPAGAEGTRFLTYRVDVVVIAEGNRDLVTNLDAYLSWRQQVRGLFKGPLLAGVPQVWEVDTALLAPLDRGLVNQDYDYSGLSFRFHTVE